MAETEAAQTWVSTGRGGAGNMPYTPRALAKRAVTLTAPQGREVDFRKQGIARSGRGGVGYWEPTLDEAAKARQEEEYKKDQDVIKENAAKRQSIVTDGVYVWKSGRGGAGSIKTPTGQGLPSPVTADAPNGEQLERVHSYGRGGGNWRMGDAIPMVELNRIETQERMEAKGRSSSETSPTAESGFATFTSYASAFFTALTPAENRVENMSTPVNSPTSPTPYAARRTSTGGGRGGAGNFGYAAYQPKSRAATNPIGTSPSIPSPSKAHLGPENTYSAYSSASYAAHDYDPERPSASSSSSPYAAGSSSQASSSWA